jgi:hypothetical protein
MTSRKTSFDCERKEPQTQMFRSLFVFLMAALVVGARTVPVRVKNQNLPTFQDTPFPQAVSSISVFPWALPVGATCPPIWGLVTGAINGVSPTAPPLFVLSLPNNNNNKTRFVLVTESDGLLCETQDTNNNIGGGALCEAMLVPLSTVQVAAAGPQGSVVFVGADGVVLCDTAVAPASCTGALFPFLNVTSAVWTSFGAVLVGEQRGLFRVDGLSPGGSAGAVVVSPVAEVSLPVTSLAFSEVKGELAVGTGLALFRSQASSNATAWVHDWVGGIIDNNITALAYDLFTGDLFIGNTDSVNILFAANETFGRWSFMGRGLPWGNVTSLSASTLVPGALWVGTTWGVALMGPTGLPNSPLRPERKYFNGPRFFPGWPQDKSAERTRVIALSAVALGGGSVPGVVVLTPQGVTVLSLPMTTLKAKAAALQSLVGPQHDRHGLVEDVYLNSYGDRSNFSGAPSDNSGLWTSVYLTAQIFQYAATKDPAAKQRVLKAFSALEMLNEITGIKGFPARSAVSPDEPPQRDAPWHPSPVAKYAGWWFKGSTSSDEIVGHMLAYTAFYLYAAETETEISRVKVLVQNLMGHIVDHGFTLVGVSGNATQWGHWEPSYINDDPSHLDERGLGSLQLLVWLLSADHMVGDTDPRFRNAFALLCTKYGYDRNIANAKMIGEEYGYLNFSDDELTYLPYLTYALLQRKVKDLPLAREVGLSIARTTAILTQGTLSERPSLWIAIAALFPPNPNDPAPDFTGALWTLRTWPTSMINWAVSNQHRHDTGYLNQLSRSSAPQLDLLLPYDELSVYRWNSDPFDVSDNNNGGNSECDPGAFLLPVWLLVWMRVVNF